MQKYNNNKKEERSEADWRGERKQERERKNENFLEHMVKFGNFNVVQADVPTQQVASSVSKRQSAPH